MKKIVVSLDLNDFFLIFEMNRCVFLKNREKMQFLKHSINSTKNLT